MKHSIPLPQIRIAPRAARRSRRCRGHAGARAGIPCSRTRREHRRSRGHRHARRGAHAPRFTGTRRRAVRGGARVAGHAPNSPKPCRARLLRSTFRARRSPTARITSAPPPCAGSRPDQTLVLVNSKRRHQSALVNVNGSVGRGSAAVDLNAIPLAAIESVEVLRDGASAQYGSDAIAGVINLRLRDAREGGGTTLTYGQYNTDVETERGQRHESDGETMTASGWVGLPLGEEGFLTLSGEYRDREPTSRGDFDNRVPGSPVTSRYGDADVQDITAYVNAGVPLEGDWNIYGWAGYQQREGNSAAFPRIFNDARNVPAIYPNGFLPLITTDIDDLAAGLGRSRQARRVGFGPEPRVRLQRGRLRSRGQSQHLLWRRLANELRRRRDELRPGRVQRRRRAHVRSGRPARRHQPGARHRGAARELRHRSRRTRLLQPRPRGRRGRRLAGLPGLSAQQRARRKPRGIQRLRRRRSETHGEIPGVGRGARRGLLGLRFGGHRQDRRPL